MSTSEYEHADVKTSQDKPRSRGALSLDDMQLSEADAVALRAIRIPPQAVCSVEGCLHVAEAGKRYCRECHENAERIAMRLAMDPKPIDRF